jgi:BirA family biotin operon repressor/biotin-[acetyl-CoA-carboxylase] ligase
MSGASAPDLPPFYHLIFHRRIGSTSDEAKALAAAGAGEGTLVWALQQSAGHGRQGREWVSPPGNLYASFILRPDVPAVIAAQLGFAAALAVADACGAVAPDAAIALKWPNDVMLAGRKTAGILLESQLKPDGRLAWVVLGIGINLATYPVNVDYPATALSVTGAEVTPAAMLAALAARLLGWYEQWRDGEGFAHLRTAWLARAQGLGQQIRVRQGKTELHGIFRGLDGDGALQLETASGLRRIEAGEVFPASR